MALTTVTLTSVYLVLHGGENVTIRDTFPADGKRVIGTGARAAGAIAKRQAIHYVTEQGKETIIPFHAISRAVIRRNTDGYIKPEDDFCKAMDCPTQPLCNEG